MTVTHIKKNRDSAIKKNEIMPFAEIQMDREMIILSESEKEKHLMILPLCRI